MYRGLLDRFVIDEADADLAPSIEAELGMAVSVLPTVMRTDEDRVALAELRSRGAGGAWPIALSSAGEPHAHHRAASRAGAPPRPASPPSLSPDERMSLASQLLVRVLRRGAPGRR